MFARLQGIGSESSINADGAPVARLIANNKRPSARAFRPISRLLGLVDYERIQFHHDYLHAMRHLPAVQPAVAVAITAEIDGKGSVSTGRSKRRTDAMVADEVAAWRRGGQFIYFPQNPFPHFGQMGREVRLYLYLRASGLRFADHQL